MSNKYVTSPTPGMHPASVNLAAIDLQNIPPQALKASDAQPGAHVVAIDDADLLPYLVHYVAHRLAGGKDFQGVPYPALPTTILTSGPLRAGSEMLHLASKLLLDKTEAARTLIHFSESPVELEHNETLELLRRFIKPASHVVVPLDRRRGHLVHAREAIARIDRLAADAGTHVMLIAPFGSLKESQSLHYSATELFHVERAEEDPHCRLAWSVSRPDLNYRQCFGGARRLVQIKSEDRRLHIEEAPLISARLIERVIWKCHRSGLTLVEIGEIVGRDKGTVSRIVRTLPTRRRDRLPDQWWSIYLESFNFSEPILTKLAESDPEK